MSIAYSSMYVPSLENKQWIHLHLKTVLPTPTFSLFLEVLLHLTGRIFWHKNHYKRAEWLSTIAINDIWRRIRFRWRISLFFQLKIKQVAQQLDTNFRVQGLISLFICYLVLDINFLRKIRNLGRYNHSHTINSTVVILELKLSLFFYQKKKKKKHFWQGQGGMF